LRFAETCILSNADPLLFIFFASFGDFGFMSGLPHGMHELFGNLWC
jgi:hypothetical protein